MVEKKGHVCLDRKGASMLKADIHIIAHNLDKPLHKSLLPNE